jgi:branched-chain amino acid transport system substrate-binding protein
MKNSSGFTRRASFGLLAAAPLLGRGLDTDITIGALLSLTGDWSTLGIASKALLEIAVAEINTFLATLSAPGRVVLRVEDTKLDPTAAVNAARVLAGQGVKLLIGPQSSAEARAILPVLTDNDMIAISQGSTAGSLSLAGDNLYRFVPDDSVEAVAIVAMALARGMKTLVPAWRNDPGNAGLAIAARRLFTAAGGTVTAGVQYETAGVNYADVARQIAAQAATGSAGKTAIFHAAFDEVVDVFRAASAVSGLDALPWYGTDGVALSVPLASDKQASAFATKVGFVAPTLLRPDLSKPKWQPLVDAVVQKTKLDPDAFALAAYDACWCGMIARLLNGGAYVATMKTCLAQAAETYFGATGWGRLNANGDRAYGDFEFWGLDGAAKWVPRAMYESGVFTPIV